MIKFLSGRIKKLFDIGVSKEIGDFFGRVGFEMLNFGLGTTGKNTGFVNNAREFFDDGLAVKFLGVGNTDEGEVSGAEKLLHFFGVATGRT